MRSEAGEAEPNEAHASRAHRDFAAGQSNTSEEENRASWLFGAPLLVALFAVVPFVLLLVPVGLEWHWFIDADETVVESVTDAVRRSPSTIDVLEVVTFLGTSAFLYPIVFVAAAAALIHKRPRLAVFAVAAATSGALLNHLVKDLVDRTRPEIIDPIALGGGPAFPSGHAMNATIGLGAAVVLACALTTRGHGLMLATAGSLVVVIGLTRLALGVHYLSDVAAGWALGVAWLAICAALLLVPRDAP